MTAQMVVPAPLDAQRRSEPQESACTDPSCWCHRDARALRADHFAWPAWRWLPGERVARFDRREEDR